MKGIVLVESTQSALEAVTCLRCKVTLFTNKLVDTQCPRLFRQLTQKPKTGSFQTADVYCSKSWELDSQDQGVNSSTRLLLCTLAPSLRLHDGRIEAAIWACFLMVLISP